MSTYRIAAGAAALLTATSIGLATADSADAAGSDRGRQRPAKTMPYRATIVTPAQLPDGTPSRDVDSALVGIADSGLVAGNVDGKAFVSAGTPRFLNGSDPDRPPRATAISPLGVVAGRPAGPAEYVLKWTGGANPTNVMTAEKWHSHDVTGINARGAMIGCGVTYRVGYLEMWNAAGKLSVPAAPTSNCDNGAIDNKGRGAATLSGPNMRHDGVFPKAVSVTAKQTTAFPMPNAKTTSTVDAMSPNGAWIIGRTGANGSAPTRPVRLDRATKPTALRGAGVIVAKGVNNSGLVVGSQYGAATSWQNGKVRDLTSMTAGLPQGWTLVDAVGVNARGDIAATAIDPTTGKTVAVKLTKN